MSANGLSCGLSTLVLFDILASQKYNALNHSNGLGKVLSSGKPVLSLELRSGSGGLFFVSSHSGGSSGHISLAL